MIAAELGVTPHSVRVQRVKRMIPVIPRKIDLMGQPLGVKTDAAIAESLGICKEVVQRERMRLGIAPPPWAESFATGAYKSRNRPDGTAWNDLPLGVVPDRELAEQLGISISSVVAARKRRGIPPVVRKPKNRGHRRDVANKGIAWDEQPLGQVSDNKLASDLGVNKSTTRNARKIRGIPAFMDCPAKGIDWNRVNWRTATVRDVVETLGVSNGEAWRHRKISRVLRERRTCACGNRFLPRRDDQIFCCVECIKAKYQALVVDELQEELLPAALRLARLRRDIKARRT